MHHAWHPFFPSRSHCDAYHKRKPSKNIFFSLLLFFFLLPFCCHCTALYLILFFFLFLILLFFKAEIDSVLGGDSHPSVSWGRIYNAWTLQFLISPSRAILSGRQKELAVFGNIYICACVFTFIIFLWILSVWIVETHRQVRLSNRNRWRGYGFLIDCGISATTTSVWYNPISWKVIFQWNISREMRTPFSWNGIENHTLFHTQPNLNDIHW